MVKMIKVPCITEFQHEWIRKETARYMFIEKEGKCTCSRCNETVEVGRTKHRGKVTCPSCGKELQAIHLWRLRSLDVIDWVVIPRTLNETTLMLRYVLAARHNESVTITELARMVIDFSTNKDYCFENINGEWVKKDAYITFLRRFLRSLGFTITNNHAFRKSLNSNILIPRGIPSAERAALLGHSIETNNRYYSKPRKGYIDNLRKTLSQDFDMVTTSHQQIILF